MLVYTDIFLLLQSNTFSNTITINIIDIKCFYILYILAYRSQKLSQNFRCDLYIAHKYSCQGISIESVQIKSSLQKYPIQSRQSN